MQVYELYFNPREEHRLTESFHYKPKNAYERRVGSLYMVGEIPDAEKKDAPLLQNIFHLAKETYYADTSLSPDKALKSTLSKANDLLREKGLGGKVNIALFASKNFSLYIGKTGEISILLANGEKRKDLGKELEDSPSGLFHNMVFGKMKRGNKLFVLTSQIHTFFQKEKIFQGISGKPLNEEITKKIGDTQKKKFSHASGVALIIDHSLTIKEEGIKFIAEKRSKKFSFRETFARSLQPLLKVKKINFRSLKKGKQKSKNTFPSLRKLPHLPIKKKPLLLPLLLLGVIVLGVSTIEIERRIRPDKKREAMILAKEEALYAKQEEDLLSMEEAFFKLEHLKKEEVSFDEDTEDIYASLKEILLSHSFLEEVTETDLLKEIETIQPENMVLANETLYLFSSSETEVITLDIVTGDKVSLSLPIEKGVDHVSFSGERTIFFSAPQTIVVLEGDIISEKTLRLPEGEDEFIGLCSFMGTPYFLSDRGNIFRYEGDTPSSWIEEGEKKTEKVTDLAIDRSIFVLTAEGVIKKYYMGKHVETLKPYIFPFFKEATRIYTPSADSPLFLLDKERKRVVIISKESESISQLAGEPLEGIKDISLSPNGKKMYLLINQEVHLLNL